MALSLQSDMMKNSKNSLCQFQLLKQVLRGDVYTDLPSRLMYATDASVYREIPMAVIRPADASDIKEIISFARSNN